MQSEIETLFNTVLLVCEELDLLDGTHFSLDVVKLSANVSKEWSGKRNANDASSCRSSGSMNF